MQTCCFILEKKVHIRLFADYYVIKMMQKQTYQKTKIPTWQTKTKSISKEKIDQCKSKIAKFDKTSMLVSHSSSSLLMSIRAESQSKHSQTQSTNNTNLKPKSKLYK